MANEKALYTLIPLDDFKSIMGIDDREDKTARFCLVTSTLTIEQYCKRKFLRKKYVELIEFSSDLYVPVREYPVSEILAVYILSKAKFSNGELLEPDFYHVIPSCGIDNDLPCAIELSSALSRYRGYGAVRVFYRAGYKAGDIPSDLSAACFELAAWNMNRYRSKKIGITSAVRGNGRDGERAASMPFEMAMPENVKALLEPYRRKTI
jgi:hypothetical protein